MKLDRPIFIVSPARTGTSLLYDLIGDHPDVGYFSRADERFPGHPALARFLTRLRLFDDSKREFRALWQELRDITDAGGGPDPIVRRIRGMLAARGVTRLVAKLPEFSILVPWLDECFPGALFVQIVRDWRPAISSMLVKAREKFGGGVFGTWPRGFEAEPDEPEALTAARLYLEWNAILAAQHARLAPRFHVLWYEDLLANPEETLAGVLGFCGLAHPAGGIGEFCSRLRPISDKWRETLTPDEVKLIRAALGEALVTVEHPAIQD